jgi:hypothetical protein
MLSGAPTSGATPSHGDAAASAAPADAAGRAAQEHKQGLQKAACRCYALYSSLDPASIYGHGHHSSHRASLDSRAAGSAGALAMDRSGFVRLLQEAHICKASGRCQVEGRGGSGGGRCVPGRMRIASGRNRACGCSGAEVQSLCSCFPTKYQPLMAKTALPPTVALRAHPTPSVPYETCIKLFCALCSGRVSLHLHAGKHAQWRQPAGTALDQAAPAAAEGAAPGWQPAIGAEQRQSTFARGVTAHRLEQMGVAPKGGAEQGQVQPGEGRRRQLEAAAEAGQPVDGHQWRADEEQQPLRFTAAAAFVGGGSDESSRDSNSGSSSGSSCEIEGGGRESNSTAKFDESKSSAGSSNGRSSAAIWSIGSGSCNADSMGVAVGTRGMFVADSAPQPARPCLSARHFAEALRRLATVAFPKIANKETAWRLLLERHIAPAVARRRNRWSGL